MRPIIGLIAVSLVFFIGWRLIRRLLFVERQHANAGAAYRYFHNIQSSQKLTSIESGILLMTGELALLEGAAEHCEKKSSLLRSTGRLFTFAASSAQPKLKTIQTGVLVLTQKRLVFVSWLETRSLQLEEIDSAKSWVDSIELIVKPSQNSVFYGVENPIVWSKLIDGLTSGRLQRFVENGLPEASHSSRIPSGYGNSSV